MMFREQVAKEFLPFVRRPQRYAGGEMNRVVRPDASVRIALCLPDMYEIGMSHLGLQMLYHRVNTSFNDVVAERVFIPDDDARELLRKKNFPLFTLETRTPLREVDLIGFSLPSELLMPGMLEALDLGGITLKAAERDEDEPIIIAGGPVMFNPEPMADFLDVVFIGDGDEASVEIAQMLRQAKSEGISRQETLLRLGKIKGIYLPHAYHLESGPEGEICIGKPTVEGLPEQIVSRTEAELKPEYYPERPLVPTTEVVHDRISLEVMRGCTRGCRFCHAGMVYRPVRERPVDEVLAQACRNMDATGYEEIGLLSLSTSDYGPLSLLIQGLREQVRGKGISLSFPSLRPDSFTEEMARALPEGRKGGITFAPEAGTQRLRDVINKNTREEDLLRAAKLAFDEGWNGIKLYFMIGLPTETQEDLDGIVDLALKTAKLRAQKRQRVTVSVSSFVPKTHTPFQWVKQDTPDSLREKLSYLRGRFKGTAIKFNGHDPDSALVEAALSRGDRRLGRVLLHVWENGGVLESWRDRFNLQRWLDAFEAADLDPFFYTRERDMEARLPWEHINKGVSFKFLARESRKALEEKTTEECRFGKCSACGLMDFFPEGETLCNRYERQVAPLETVKQPLPPGGIGLTARVRYTRGEAMRWTGHLDLVRVWDRLLRRAEIPIAFSQGFHPHPRVSFGPPLPVGLLSCEEYIDLELAKPLQASELLSRLRDYAPDGLDVVEIRTYPGSPPSPAAIVERIQYQVPFPLEQDAVERITNWLKLDSSTVERVKKGKVKRVDIRPFIEQVTLAPESSTFTVRLINGATVRLDELEKVWELSPGSLSGVIRQWQWTSRDGEFISLYQAADAVLKATSVAHVEETEGPKE